MKIENTTALAPLTTLRIGGSASFFTVADSIEAIREATEYARRNSLHFAVLGGGSNVLIPDEGVNGLVIKNEITGIHFEEDNDHVRVTAGAGENFDALVEETIARELYGLENLSGIPGTVGATPIQNIGAYGAEIADLIEWVEVFDAADGSTRKMSAEKCAFGYRDSIFKHTEGSALIITRVQYRLSRSKHFTLEYKDIRAELTKRNIDSPTERELREIVLSIRRGKFPDLAQFGTAGSFFKNPVITEAQFGTVQEKFSDVPRYAAENGMIKIPLGFILERLGFKGKRTGNVGLYEKQALVLVNYGNATAYEVNTFANMIVDAVKKETDLSIEREVKMFK
jgi:UDP-N-acetylmuramate dehydrogenase